MIIKTKLPKNIVAMAIWPLILVRPGAPVAERVINHERIHHAQQKEMLLLLFYLWYGVEYLVRLCQQRSYQQAYHHISFELEAEHQEKNRDYMSQRKHYSFLKYL